jgi:hypothetical protein
MAATKTSDVLEIQPVQSGVLNLAVLGKSPLVLNRLSEKARHELLLPAGRRRSAAARAESLKHTPLSEFAAAPYTHDDPETLLAIMATSFKGAMRTAALDLPGATKAQIGRLTYVEGDYVGIYGIPQVYMSIVRSADANRTPDVRTRCILKNWAAIVSINYVRPLITEKSVLNLLAAAGVTAGVGDGRVEKGSMSFGRFTVVDPSDEEFQKVLASGGRAAQEAAMANPTAYDRETADLLEWFDIELAKRVA